MKSRAQRTVPVILVLCSALGSSACLSARPAVWERGRPTLQQLPLTGGEKRDLEALEPKLDAAWQERADPAQLKTALGFLDKAIKLDPSVDRYVMKSRGWNFLAEGELALSGASAKERRAAYDTALAAAEMALGMSSPELVKKVRGGGSFLPALAVLEPESAGPLYWYAVNLARWAEMDGPVAVFRNRDRVVGCMKRVLELDADYHHAGAHRYLGAYMAASLPMAGRDLTRARHHFQESLSRSPRWFATKVLMAQHLAVKTRDRTLFERLLKDVLAEDAAVLPDLAPEQALEKLKAEALLKQANRLF